VGQDKDDKSRKRNPDVTYHCSSSVLLPTRRRTKGQERCDSSIVRGQRLLPERIEHTIPIRKWIREPLILTRAKIYRSWEIGNILARHFANGNEFLLSSGLPTKNKNVRTDAFRDTSSPLQAVGQVRNLDECRGNEKQRERTAHEQH
jgi:hypothetical protein